MKSASFSRPLRTVPSSKKDSDYHYKYAQWCLNSINSDQHRYFQAKSMVNWNFLYGNQWILDEDLETFMMDESGNTRNRLKIVENTVRPMVNALVGKVIQMDLSAKAYGTSDRAVSRMEKELAKLLFYQSLYTRTNDPGLKETIKAKVPVADTAEETFDRFHRFWRDEYVAAINALIKNISELNNLESIKVESALSLAVTGMSVIKEYELNGGHRIDVIDPLFFIWDPSAKKPDLSDSSFWGEYSHEDPAYLIERFPEMSLAWKEALEKSSSATHNTSSFHQDMNIFGVPLGRVPKYEIYWRDVEAQEYGYVIDEFGYELYTRIDVEDGQYSIEDVVMPQDEKAREAMKGKLTHKIWRDVLRYCVFCPPEYVSNPSESGIPLVLEHGVAKYSETFVSDISNVQSPYKVATWQYHNGYIQAPVDDAIGPQRFLNRLLSMAEAQVNNSRGSGIIYDKDMVDGQDGEQEMLRSMNLSKPVGVRAKGQLNNSVSTYDTTAKQGTLSLFEIAQNVRASIDNSTGRNVAMRGQQGGKRESGVVVNQMLDAGATMQEPFFFAISQQMLKVSQAMATKGKKIYIANQRKLSLAVGDSMRKVITLHPDMMLEDFRVYIKRSMPEDESKAAAALDLKELATVGLVDEEAMAKWYGVAHIEDVSSAIQETFNRKIEKSKIAAREQAAAEEQAIEAQGAEIDRQEEMAAAAADVERQHEVENLSIKGQQGIDKLALREHLRRTAP